ncbi:MAG: monofunctional biosynthetic peptidoglycan transglycosylase [Bacteroidales bacterium]|nr:monofunctional biosynthetic peptidoglycan transglycosylase [Bacteroidales bacterium]
MKRWKKIVFFKIPLLLIGLSLLWVTLLKAVPAYYTPLMIKRSVQFREDEGFKTVRTWVPLEKISPEMIKAVIAAEDNRFAQHNGFDTVEIRRMLHQHTHHGKKLRGCSTISQQTAKNVFTLCSDTGWRKIVEAYYTFLIEKIWGKRRIMEVYLNVAETGKGIYGVEAAAKAYYGTSAAKLNASQAARIAACLPSPLKRRPDNPGKYVLQREKQIKAIMGKLSYPDWVKKR